MDRGLSQNGHLWGQKVDTIHASLDPIEAQSQSHIQPFQKSSRGPTFVARACPVGALQGVNTRNAKSLLRVLKRSIEAVFPYKPAWILLPPSHVFALHHINLVLHLVPPNSMAYMACK